MRWSNEQAARSAESLHLRLCGSKGRNQAYNPPSCHVCIAWCCQTDFSLSPAGFCVAVARWRNPNSSAWPARCVRGKAAESQRQRLCACIFLWPLISGVKQSLELGKSGGGGRSALRPGGNSRACRVDRPPALFSHAEENPRPYEPAYSSSTGDGPGSGGPDRKLNSGRVL